MTAPCGAIILAAGQSRRMGSNKLLAELDGTPLIAHVVDAVSVAGLPPPIVVLGHAEKEVRASLVRRPAKFVIAKDHAKGMARSLAAGIAAVPSEWQAAIICLGDMPLISPILLRLLAQRANPSAVIVPTFKGRRGNPVLWGRDFFDDIALLQGDTGARSLFETHAAAIIPLPWSDNNIHDDVDTREALAALRKASGNHP